MTGSGDSQASKTILQSRSDASAGLYAVLQRIVESGDPQVTVTEENIGDLMDLHDEGDGKNLQIKLPSLGDGMSVDDLMRLVENAHYIAGESRNGQKLPDIDEELNPVKGVPLTPEQFEALREIKRILLENFDIRAFVLYGSATRGQADEESDLDLLIVTSQPLTRFERHEITNVVFDVNLRHDTKFSTLVVDLKLWETGVLSVLPLHDEILRDGIPV
jgi:predicted nucleotidyltransferase